MVSQNDTHSLLALDPTRFSPVKQVEHILASYIEKRETTPISLMPDAQVRDLLAYLAGKGQVELPK